MTQDEAAIRELISAWMEATKRGDIAEVLNLMTEDAVFLRAGKPPMDKSAFESTSLGQTSANMRIEGRSEIKEVQVDGDLAYAWTNLTVTMTPPGAEAPNSRSGATLTVFKRIGGRWLLHRDANLLSESKSAAKPN